MIKQYSTNINTLLNLIKKAISNNESVCETDNVDWKWIYETSIRHSVCNIIAYSIDKLTNKPTSQIVSLFDKARYVSLVQDGVQRVKTKEVLSKMEQHGVINMPMKGCIIKNLYPSPDMRSMCDIDILIKEGCMDDAEKIMKELKFPVREGGGREVVYKKPPMLSFELHRSFVSEKYHKVIFDYYKQIWEKAKLTAGKQFSYELSNEDFYIYMIVHIAKHYLSGGVGIRAILDVYVFLEHYNEALDKEYINCELKKINLHLFNNHIKKLAYVWFADEIDDDVTYNMTEFIFNGGTYGSKLYADAAYTLRECVDSSKNVGFKRFLKAVFLPYENMCGLYPSLKKHKWLLGFYWIYRIIDRVINKPQNVKLTMQYTAKEDDVKGFKKHLQYVGLM